MKNVSNSFALVAIGTKFLGPTDHRGSRVKAFRMDDKSVAVTLDWDHALDSVDNHRAAIEAFIAQRESEGGNWAGRWIIGAGTDGFVAVRDTER